MGNKFGKGMGKKETELEMAIDNAENLVYNVNSRIS